MGRGECTDSTRLDKKVENAHVVFLLAFHSSLPLLIVPTINLDDWGSDIDQQRDHLQLDHLSKLSIFQLQQLSKRPPITLLVSLLPVQDHQN